MIIIDNALNYNFRFGFNQTQDYIINSLEKEFKQIHGETLFNECSLIIIIENQNFYHVIRNKHKVRVSGELVDNLCNDLQSHI
jgi:hypothetical protein|tara:strand:- start:264 stop:512 length:249 start_codon:yes stop_codon:yes gene_type:complete